MKKAKSLFIKRHCLKTIARWSATTQKEVGFVCVGEGGTISHVVRLRNIANRPREFIFWNMCEYKFVMKELERRGLKYVAEGHSHPNGQFCPSATDVRWMKKGHVELIAATKGKRVLIGAWQIKKSYLKTRKRGRVPLILC